LKIAVWVDNTSPYRGGSFQYVRTLLPILKELENDSSFSFLIIYSGKKNNDFLEYINELKFDVSFLNLHKIEKLTLFIKASINPFFQKYLQIIPNRLDIFLRKKSIDLLYFPFPSIVPYITEKFNFLYTVFDLCHRDYPEFPEVYINREFETREFAYKNILPKAVAILVDSEVGKQKVCKYYNISQDRVYVFPYLPSISVWNLKGKPFSEIKNKFGIALPYVYYPAQFWPHKNQIYILKAVKILKDKYNVKINIVFSGSDKGNLSYVLNYAQKLGIRDQVYYTGFVSDEELVTLYKHSICLIMPTWFGPTNIPPLEAFHLGVPVIYSDLPELKEQVNDAALLVNLLDPKDLACKIKLLLENESLREELILKGKENLKAISSKKFLKTTLRKIFDDYRIKLSTWKKC
jgi:glycosyltransferase involved in cell wall biosynthesis